MCLQKLLLISVIGVITIYLFFKKFSGDIEIIGSLTTKDSRTVWEDAFMTTYLNPVLSVSFLSTI